MLKHHLKSILTCVYVIISFTVISGQNYISYLTGDTADVSVNPQGGTCLVGGAGESDDAMKWFLQRADGGDVLVLRASGSDGYNPYFYSQLGVTINSVETIVFNNALAANDSYVQQRVAEAEAIWFAGGNQWNYVSYWRNTAIDSLINDGLQNRNIVIGGTSAGMAILGDYYFSAQNGSVTSTTALNNPFASNVTIDSMDFLNIDFLENVVTDTHYDDPDRKGRHMVFLARMLHDYGVDARGIACDEYTAVCIDENGIAHAFGEYPQYDDNVYFLQVNCENINPTPETLVNGQPLDWNLGGKAVKVYTIKGKTDGSNTFNLNTWESGTGGEWKNWYVTNGTLNESVSTQMNCSVNTNPIDMSNQIKISPNPVSDFLAIETDISDFKKIQIFDVEGRLVKTTSELNIDISDLKKGSYIVEIQSDEKVGIVLFLKI